MIANDKPVFITDVPASRSAPRIALFGEYDTSNLGDTAIGIAACTYFLSLGYSLRIFAFGSFSFLGDVDDAQEAVSKMHGFREQHWRKLLPSFKLKRARKFLEAPRNAMRLLRNRYRSPHIRRHLRECSVIVIGGGELLNASHTQFSLTLHEVTALSKTLHIPLVCLATGTGKLSSIYTRRYLRPFLAQLSFLAVRDVRSMESLSALHSPVHLCGDFVLHRRDQISIHDQKKNLIGINVKQEEDTGQKEYKTYILELIRIIQHKGPEVSITLFTTGNEADLKLAKELQAARPGVALLHPQTLNELIVFFKEVKSILACRVHAALLAWGEGVTVIGLETGPKLKSVFTTYGLSDKCFPLQDSNKVVHQIAHALLAPDFQHPDVSSFADEWKEFREVFSKLTGKGNLQLK